MSGEIDARKPRPLPAGTVCLIGSRHGRETPAADGLAAEVLPRGMMATPSGHCKLTK